jgi:hypothetical protein
MNQKYLILIANSSNHHRRGICKYILHSADGFDTLWPGPSQRPGFRAEHEEYSEGTVIA